MTLCEQPTGSLWAWLRNSETAASHDERWRRLGEQLHSMGVSSAIGPTIFPEDRISPDRSGVIPSRSSASRGAGRVARTTLAQPSIVIVIVFLAALIGCGGERTKSVPDELVGVWRTTAPKYADRFLKLTRTAIIFGTGGEGSYARTVVAVEKSREDGDTLYTVFYVDAEGEYKLAFYYESQNGGVIRYKNQRAIAWTRQKGAVATQGQPGGENVRDAFDGRAADRDSSDR
jgi:hypothetical protein